MQNSNNPQPLPPFRKALASLNSQRRGLTDQLVEAYEGYRKLLRENPGLSLHEAGAVKCAIWEIEQQFGHHHLFFSAFGQDAFVFNTFFRNREAGTFVEVGGYNGWRGSNCYFFEKTLGWQGAIVEASGALIPQIKACRKVEVIHAAVGEENTMAEFVEVESGLTQMGHLKQYASEETVNQIRAYPGHAEKTVSVPMRTLNTILESLGMQRVDYLSLDIEGADLHVLRSFDFSACDIKVISVESSPQQSARQILQAAGYRLVNVLGDEIYAKASFLAERGYDI